LRPEALAHKGPYGEQVKRRPTMPNARRMPAGLALFSLTSSYYIAN